MLVSLRRIHERATDLSEIIPVTVGLPVAAMFVDLLPKQKHQDINICDKIRERCLFHLNRIFRNILPPAIRPPRTRRRSRRLRPRRRRSTWILRDRWFLVLKFAWLLLVFLSVSIHIVASLVSCFLARLLAHVFAHLIHLPSRSLASPIR